MVTYNGTFTPYLDGVADGVTTTVALQGVTEDEIAELGSFNQGASRSLRGPVDDVRIYHRALKATEVTQLFNLGSP